MPEGKLSELHNPDVDWHKKSTLRRIWTPFQDAVLAATAQKQPLHVSFYYLRYFMNLFGLWPTKPEEDQRRYIIINRIIMSILLVFIATITCDVYEASSDIVRLGDDLVVLVGVSISLNMIHTFNRLMWWCCLPYTQLYLIYLKIALFWQRRADIGAIIDKFDEFHQKFTLEKEDDHDCKSCYWQRRFYIYEILTFPSYLVLAFVLWCAISIQPLFSQEHLPFRAKLPFGLHNREIYSGFNVFLYTFQMICTFYCLISVILCDGIGCHSFSQATLNLKIVGERLRNLGMTRTSDKDVWDDLRDIVEYHQKIINLIEQINKCFYSNYVSQMGASTFMICLTAFETLLAKDQPMVALKFEVYMLSAFIQLFYWCFLGNLTYFCSLEIAAAAFEVHRWYDHSPKIQRQLIFLINRAQYPLAFRAKPFPKFTVESFMNILSTSYSYFALLRTMND